MNLPALCMEDFRQLSHDNMPEGCRDLHWRFPTEEKRVLHGTPGRRVVGHRLPNDHTTLTSTAMSLCLRFL